MQAQPIRILLIEDDEDDYVIFRHYLNAIEDRGFELEWLADATAAPQHIGKQAYDICFIDYQLNGCTGLDVIRQLKNAGFEPPIVVLTGRGSHEADVQSMQEGAVDFLEKNHLDAAMLERTIRYVIEHSKTIAKLTQSEQRLQSLSAKLIDALENERKMMARELHDSIGSSLTAIKFSLESKLMEGDKLAQGMPLDKIIAIVCETIEETQRIANNLRPLLLDDMGLIKTIAWICRTFQEVYHDIHIEYRILATEEDVPEPLRIVICRILQEALNNVRKHSQADTVLITLSRTDARLELRIKDNGLGFDAPLTRDLNGRLGIESMKDRADLSNGIFSISSAPGAGTVIHVAWAI